MPASDDDSLLQALRADLRKTAQGSDSSLAHDDLAEFNHAVHFEAFVEEAEAARLASLAEAHPSSSTGMGLARGRCSPASIVSRASGISTFCISATTGPKRCGRLAGSR